MLARASAETPYDLDTSVGAILKLAGDYLEKRVAAARKTKESKRTAEREAKLAGAICQRRMAEFVLENCVVDDPVSRGEVGDRLEAFWHLYFRKACDCARGAGLSMTPQLEARLWQDQVETLQHGVKGALAVAFMAREAGMRVQWPTIELDVDWRVDMYLEKDGKKVPVQIKCSVDILGLSVDQDNEEKFPFMFIRVPAQPNAFLDKKLGIPNKELVRTFKKDTRRFYE